MGRVSIVLQQVFVFVVCFMCFVAVDSVSGELSHGAAESFTVGVGGLKDDEKFCTPPSSPSSPSYGSPAYSSPSYSSPPYSPSYSSPTYSPSPSSPSSPDYSPVTEAPVSAPDSPWTTYPTTPASPDCPPLASWFSSPSPGSSSWWDDQLAAEDKPKSASENAAGVNEDKLATVPGGGKLGIPGFFSPPPPSPPLIPASGPYSGAPETSAEPGTWEYWASHNSAIPAFLEGLVVTLFEILGELLPFSSGTTLMQALTTTRPDAYGALMRQGAAALINSYHFANYAYTPLEVKQSFNGALYSEQAAAVQAVKFENANRGLHVRPAP